MEQPGPHQNLPNRDRLSLLAATILLAYALTRFIDMPSQAVVFEGFGLYVEIAVNFQAIVGLLVAAITASGTEWLLRDHPALGKQRTIQHWLLPALTAWAIQLPLSQLPQGYLWWLGFGVGGLLLVLVLVAEYIVVDLDDIRQPLASAGLTAVSFTLFLVLAATLHYSETRLLFLLPLLAFASGLISLRNLHLRVHKQWSIPQAIVVSFSTTQVAAALHYWPVSPVAFGLMVLAPAYTLTSFIGNITEGEPIRQAVVEPLLVLILLMVAGFLLK